MILTTGTLSATGRVKKSVSVTDDMGLSTIINIEKGEKVAVPVFAAQQLIDEGLIWADQPLGEVAKEEPVIVEETSDGN